VKVALNITLDVDSAAWREIYGLMDIDDIREDVRSYVTHHLFDSAAAREGGITDVTVKR
jgi:hypothetical protein